MLDAPLACIPYDSVAPAPVLQEHRKILYPMQSSDGCCSLVCSLQAKHIPPKQLRMVIFIDDLDRCDKENIMKTLAAINLVLGACNYITVLGIAPEMVEKAIKVSLADEGLVSKTEDKDKSTPTTATDSADDFGQQYLRKIVQVSLVFICCVHASP